MSQNKYRNWYNKLPIYFCPGEDLDPDPCGWEWACPASQVQWARPDYSGCLLPLSCKSSRVLTVNTGPPYLGLSSPSPRNSSHPNEELLREEDTRSPTGHTVNLYQAPTQWPLRAKPKARCPSEGPGPVQGNLAPLLGGNQAGLRNPKDIPQQRWHGYTQKPMDTGLPLPSGSLSSAPYPWPRWNPYISHWKPLRNAINVLSGNLSNSRQTQIALFFS